MKRFRFLFVLVTLLLTVFAFPKNALADNTCTVDIEVTQALQYGALNEAKFTIDTTGTADQFGRYNFFIHFAHPANPLFSFNYVGFNRYGDENLTFQGTSEINQWKPYLDYYGFTSDSKLYNRMFIQSWNGTTTRTFSIDYAGRTVFDLNSIEVVIAGGTYGNSPLVHCTKTGTPYVPSPPLPPACTYTGTFHDNQADLTVTSDTNNLQQIYVGYIGNWYGDEIVPYPFQLLGIDTPNGEPVFLAGRPYYQGGAMGAYTGGGTSAGPYTLHFNAPETDQDLYLTYQKTDGTFMPLCTYVPVPTNHPPVSNGGSDQTALVNQLVSFNGSGSSDPDGINDIVSYNWDFGDGSTASGVTAGHVYTQAGTFTATLTVADKAGASNSDTVTITILTPAQGTQNLINLVQAYNLQQGIANSFDSKLQNAYDSLTSLNAGNRQDAINKFQAFISAVQAQSGNKLTVSQANALIQAAQQIISSL